MPTPSSESGPLRAWYGTKLEALEQAQRAEFSLDRELERANVLRWLGRVRDSEQALLTAERAADAQGEESAKLRIRLGVGAALCARAEWKEARRILTEVIEAARVRGLVSLEVEALGVLASSLFNVGRPADAEPHLRLGLELARAHQDVASETTALMSLGVVALAQHRRGEAFSLLDESRAMATSLIESPDASLSFRMMHWRGMAQSYLGAILHLDGDDEAAFSMYGESIDSLRRIGVRRGLGVARLGRGLLHLSRLELAPAEDDFRAALSDGRATSPDYEPVLEAALSLCAQRSGDDRAARYRATFAAQALREGFRPSFHEIVKVVAAAIDGSSSAEELSSLPSLEAHLFEHCLQALRGREPGLPLVVGPAGRWFQLGEGKRGDLGRRKLLQRLIVCLAENHRRDPGSPVSLDALLRAGWPGERMTARAGRSRVYTAMSTLRGMGLSDVLGRSSGGYALSVRVRIEMARAGGDF